MKKQRTVDDSSMDWFCQQCKEKGLKLTHQRLEVYREIAAGGGHPCAEELYRRLHPRLPTLSLDTVYRTLMTFEKHGLIRRVEVLDDRARFDANLRNHHHLVCNRCRRAFDFYWPAVDQIETPKEVLDWGNIQSRHLELRGVCNKCLRG
jgi:Fur family peroxide stress response transcriptional regulator